MGKADPRNVDPIRTQVRAAGLKCTPARLAVMQQLVDARGPRTHGEIFDALAERGFDRATIYRNLTELTECNLVTRVEVGDHVSRFELKRIADTAGHGKNHPHFVCRTCGEVLCLDDVRIVMPRKPKVGNHGHGTKLGGKPTHARAIHSITEIFLKGQCDRCG